MSHCKLFALAPFLTALVLSTPAASRLVTYQAEGTLTSFFEDKSLLLVEGQVGDPVVMEFSFDTEATDSNPDPIVGVYDAEYLTLKVGDYPVIAYDTARVIKSSFDNSSWGVQGCMVTCEDQYDNVVNHYAYFYVFSPDDTYTDDSLILPPYPTPEGSRVAFFMVGSNYTTFTVGNATFTLNNFIDISVRDTDGDGVPNDEDNCPTVSNPEQIDANGDGFGDVCVSPGANISDSVDLGDGVVVEGRVLLSKDTSVGDRVTIQSNVSVAKGTTIGESVIVSDGAAVQKDTTIGRNTVIGENVRIAKGVTIGEGVIIGNNARILKDVVIGDDAVIGNGVLIEAGVSIEAGEHIPDGTEVYGSSGN